MKIVRAALGLVLSVFLVVIQTGCQSAPTATQSDQSAASATSIASMATEESSGPDTTPHTQLVDDALSAEAEVGGIVGATGDSKSLTPTELQFGRSPKLDSTVTYQPDVLIMEHGDTALKSMESNAMIWHFDASAPHVDQIQTGKIIFATERCVGRVAQVQRTATDVAVLLLPVQITDVIQKAHFVYNQPLDLNSVVAVPAPDLPMTIQQDPFGTQPAASSSAAPTVAPTTTTTGHILRGFHIASITYAMVTKAGKWKPFRRVSYDAHGRSHQHYLRMTSDRVAQAAPIQLPPGATSILNPPNVPNVIPTGLMAPPATVGVPQNVDVQGVDALPCLLSCGGFGIQIEYDHKGLKVIANAVFFLQKPSIHFNVDIDNGIKNVGISLEGAGGFKTHFEMGADETFAGNIHITGNVPIDISIPIFNFAVPISVHLIQSLFLSTGFSARTSTLSETISFKACCRLAVGYRNGSWGGDTPNVSADATGSTVDGISMGINSLAFGLRQEVLVGIGAFGFSSGPYLALSTGISALKQASEAMADCRQATLAMDFSAGVGWTLPKPVVSVINFFLKALSIAPMSGAGSFLEMKPSRMVTYRGSLPHGCAGS